MQGITSFGWAALGPGGGPFIAAAQEPCPAVGFRDASGGQIDDDRLVAAAAFPFSFAPEIENRVGTVAILFADIRSGRQAGEGLGIFIAEGNGGGFLVNDAEGGKLGLRFLPPQQTRSRPRSSPETPGSKKSTWHCRGHRDLSPLLPHPAKIETRGGHVWAPPWNSLPDWRH